MLLLSQPDLRRGERQCLELGDVHRASAHSGELAQDRADCLCRLVSIRLLRVRLCVQLLRYGRLATVAHRQVLRLSPDFPEESMVLQYLRSLLHEVVDADHARRRAVLLTENPRRVWRELHRVAIRI